MAALLYAMMNIDVVLQFTITIKPKPPIWCDQAAYTDNTKMFLFPFYANLWWSVLLILTLTTFMKKFTSNRSDC